MEKTPEDLVFENKVLLGKILFRLGCTKSLLRCSIINSTWNEVSSSRAVLELFARGNRPALLGFLASYEYVDDDIKPVAREATRLLHQAGAGGRVDHSALLEDRVYCSIRGNALVKKSDRQCGYFSTCLLDKQKSYHRVAPCFGTLSGNAKDCRLGQFGVIHLPGGESVGFFQADLSGQVSASSSNDGIKFKGNPGITVRVNTLKGNKWIPKDSGVMHNATPWTLNKHPYCMTSRNILFIAYIVGYVICYDMANHDFALIMLPKHTYSCLEYNLCPHDVGVIAMVHCSAGCVTTWILNDIDDKWIWAAYSTVDLKYVLRGFFDMPVLEHMSVIRGRRDDPVAEFWSAKIRSCTDDAYEILLSFSFDSRMFIVDLDQKSATEVLPDPDYHIRADGELRAILPLAEIWPPTVNRYVRQH
jgi:hypothetical protein